VACRELAPGTLGLPRVASSPGGFVADVPASPVSALPTLLNVLVRPERFDPRVGTALNAPLPRPAYL
jgi:hypothetical protein